MFFSDRIQSILPTDKVLEVGPGSLPHPRADVYLEKNFSAEEAYIQSGYAQPVKLDGKVVYYDGAVFPFEDKEFDYVICSHVVEHVASDDIPFFLRELERVAWRGYIEFPNALYELFNNQDAHKTLCVADGNEIVYYDKKGQANVFNSPMIELWRRFFYNKFTNFDFFREYKQVFFDGFEWEKVIKYRKVEEIQDIVSIIDRTLEGPSSIDSEGAPKNLAKRIMRKFCNFFFKIAKKVYKICFKKKNFFVSPSAIIENRDFVIINEGAELKDYVIIRTYSDIVKIGRYTQLNPFVVIYGGNGVEIGDNVMIAPHTVIASGNHKMSDLTRPMRWAGSDKLDKIVIKDDVWIGANCTIVAGVTIGKGAVVGANSVVTKNVQDYDVVCGVPAIPIKSRWQYAHNSKENDPQ